MPEIKHNFTGGKMNKDLDERLVPDGEYTHAMNVQVSTSDNSEVGTVQNLLSNYKVNSSTQDSIIGDYNTCIGSIADEKNNAVYWFLSAGEYSLSSIIMNTDYNDAILPTNTIPYFNPLVKGSSIMEYKDNVVSPVVIDNESIILPLYSYNQLSVATQAGYTLDTFLTFFPSPNTSVVAGMVLTAVHVIQPSWSTGDPATITNTYDFSSGANYSTGGPSPTTLSSSDPPIAQFNPTTLYAGSIQLSYTPDDLLTELYAGSILAFEFTFNESEYSPPLNFQSDTIITGINIIDDMLFWTDNYNEPKKINITRCKEGTPTNPVSFTRIINEKRNITLADNIPLSEEHVTVIRKPPSKAPVLELRTGRDYSGLENNPPEVYTGVIIVTSDQSPAANDDDSVTTTNNPFNTDPYDFSGVSVGETIQLEIAEDIYGNSYSSGGFTLVGWDIGTQVVLKEFDELSSGAPDPPAIPITNYRIKGEITDVGTNGFTADASGPIIVDLEITNIDGFPLGADPISGDRKYAIDLFDVQERLFEFKFPRFATRYKYSDGEYSTYSPFTQVAFVPGTFDYHPKKGYNLGMTNLLTEVGIKNFRLNDTPLDVVEIDILYKEDGSPNIYVVDTIKKISIDNYWDDDIYTIKNETIKATVPSNQLLRSWDNVPKTALAQEITGNRIVYANYTQGWDVFDTVGNPYSPQFKIDLLGTSDALGWSDPQTNTVKSIKSLREYQVGVVFIDEYGRETPVISNPTGAFDVDYSRAPQANRLRVGFESDPPRGQKYYKFYIKQTSGEYYNMAMDRWYDAEDGNVWLSFPSSDRNKIDIDTFLLLKKSQESNDAVDSKNRYKVLAIENQAPDFVRTKRLKVIDAKHLNAATNPVFNANTLIDAPTSGKDEFTMNYNHFGNSSGSRLHEIDDGELYFSVSLTGSTAESKRYRITSITTDAFDVPAVGVPKYYIKVDEFLGDDVNFITDDPTGQSMNEIQDNAVINIYKYKIENLPIFDGKFFVKIYIDDTFRNYIAQQTSQNQEWRVVTSKRVYSMRKNHHKTHSIRATGHGEDPNAGGNGGGMAYSHPFGRFACYFRRYDYGNKEWPNTDLSNASNFDMSTSKYRFDSPNNLGNITVSGYVGNSSWFNEFYLYTGFHRDTAGWGDATSVYVTDWDSSSANYYLTGGAAADNSARDNEVWFLDMYKHVDRATSSQNALSYTTHPSNQVNQFNPNSMSGGIGPEQPIGNSSQNDALDISTGWHHFKLTLGPIFWKGAIGNNQAWNDWSALDQSNKEGILHDTLNQSNSIWFEQFFGIGTGSPYYNDSPTVNFTDRLNTGNTWRWREDPLLTRYDITGNVSERNIIRYFAKGDWGNTGDMLRETAGSMNSNGTIIDGHLNGAQLSPNFNKTWRWTQEHETKQLDWVPADAGGNQSDIGPITPSGRETTLTTANPAHISNSTGPFGNHVAPGSTIPSGGSTITGDNANSIGIDEHYIVVTQASYLAAEDQFGNPCRVVPGYVVKTYVNESATTKNCDTGTTDPYLVVRDVIVDNGMYNGVASTKIFLTGYVEALDLAHVIKVDPSTSITFAQGAMNGYSPNSAARISLQKSTTGKGAFTNNANSGTSGPSTNLLYAVGYTMEFIEPTYDNEVLPENPAIWETEPKDQADLDIYYEASDLIPIELNSNTDSGFLPLQDESVGQLSLQIGTFENCTIAVAAYVTGFSIPSGTEIIGSEGNVLLLSQAPVGIGGAPIAIGNSDYVHITKPDGSIFSSLVEGISADTIRINLTTWKQWHTLNWYNCYSFGNGVESNRIRDDFNQPFISNGVRASSTLEEKIEKETRKYGLIFSGIYNSVSSTNSLNQFITAEKITKEINPTYGSIQKLHSRSTADGDLIALCEDRILKILANKDAVYNADGNPQLTANINVLGQTIPFVGEYGISQNPESFASESYRVYFADKQRGAILRLSQDGLTPISDHGMKDWFRDHLKLSNKLIGSYDEKKDEYNIALKPSYVVSFREDVRGWVSFKSFVQIESGVSMASNYYTFYEGKIYEHHHEGASANLYNNFYSFSNPSTISVLLNDSPGTVKSFKTLMYEGSQAKITQDLQDDQYYNLQAKKGWYLQNLNTDMQVAANVEFIEKENKWFNYIKGTETSEIEEKDFTYQGIGIVRFEQLNIDINTNTL